MKIHRLLTVPTHKTTKLDIPSNLTHNQLNDSGYTYHFNVYKKQLKEEMLNDIASTFECEIIQTPFGYELKGTMGIGN